MDDFQETQMNLKGCLSILGVIILMAIAAYFLSALFFRLSPYLSNLIGHLNDFWNIMAGV